MATEGCLGVLLDTRLPGGSADPSYSARYFNNFHLFEILPTPLQERECPRRGALDQSLCQLAAVVIDRVVGGIVERTTGEVAAGKVNGSIVARVFDRSLGGWGTSLCMSGFAGGPDGDYPGLDSYRQAWQYPSNKGNQP